jgi:phospholipase/carboxylesterase
VRLLILLALAACTKQEIAKPPPPLLDALEFVTGDATKDERLPLIVGLHGLGDRPESFAQVFGAFEMKARIVVPRAPRFDGHGYRWFDARTQGGDVARISREIAAATELVDRMLLELETKHGVRPIVTGFSQGGMLSFAIAARHPDRISASVPIAGWLPPPLWPESKPARAPIVRALHGTGDSVVPFALDQRTCDHLRELGYDVALDAYERIDHTVTPEMHRRWLEILRELASAR